MRHLCSRPTATLAIVALLIVHAGGTAWAQSGSVQVVGDPGLAVHVGGESVGVTSSEAGGLLVADVPTGDQRVQLLETDAVIWDEVVPVLAERVTVVRPADPWPVQFGTGAIERVTSLVASASGTLLVGGYVEGSLDASGPITDDGFVHALDDEGRLLWTHPLDTPEWDRVTAIAVGADGTVFVAGWTAAGMMDPLGGFVRALDVDGNEMWTYRFGTDAEDRVTAIAVGPKGTVFVAGSTEGQVGATQVGESDGFVLAVDGAGSVLWSRQFGTDAWDEVEALAIGPDGAMVVAGRTRGSLGGPSAGSWDAFVHALDGSGRPLWSHQFGTEAADHAQALAAGPDGTVYVAGRSDGAMAESGAGSQDGFVRALDGEGRERWTYAFGTSVEDQADALALGSDGAVFVAGRTATTAAGAPGGWDDGFVRALDTQGRLLWVHVFGSPDAEEVTSVTVGSAGDVFAAGSTRGSFGGPTEGRADGFVYRVPFRVE